MVAILDLQAQTCRNQPTLHRGHHLSEDKRLAGLLALLALWAEGHGPNDGPSQQLHAGRQLRRGLGRAATEQEARLPRARPRRLLDAGRDAVARAGPVSANPSAVLEQAERRSDELFTKSIGKSVKAAFTSQAATDYAGEDYEKVLLNVIKALDSLRMGDTEGALVEARKINEKLAYFNTKYAHKNVYNQDAFAHWLTGMLYEMEKSYDDARIAYEAALRVYGNDFAQPLPNGPTRLRRRRPGPRRSAQRRRGAGAAGIRASTAPAARQRTCSRHTAKSSWCISTDKGPARAISSSPAGSWTLIAGPVTPNRAANSSAGFALHVPETAPSSRSRSPSFTCGPRPTRYLTMTVGQASARSQPAYPLNAIAAKTLRDRMHRIFRQAIVRAITKYLTQKAAQAAGNAESRGSGLVCQGGRQPGAAGHRRGRQTRLDDPAGTHRYRSRHSGAREIYCGAADAQRQACVHTQRVRRSGTTGVSHVSLAALASDECPTQSAGRGHPQRRREGTG